MTTRVLFHNVGHGHAVHVFTPDGKTVVVDLGCSAVFSPLEWLRKTTSTIDMLVVTHPHGDHIDEFLLLKKLGFTVKQLYRPKWLTKEEIYAANQVEYRDRVDAYLEMSATYTYDIAEDNRVGNPTCTGGVSIEVFSSSGCGRSNINNHSMVAVIKYANSTVVIPGDNESASWQELLAQQKFVSATSGVDVFLASHHGRESGFCGDVFADPRKPRLFVVSDGAVQDTSATSRYASHARGWQVNKRSGTTEQRNVVTTRSDGYVDVKLGYTGTTPFLSVSID